MKKIVTLTVNPALDLYTTVERVQPGKKMRCENPRTDPGGGGVNVSRVVHRLGGNTKAIYTCGGFTGQKYSELLRTEKIASEIVEVKENMRENFAVFETSTKKLFRFGMPGAKLSDAECDEVLKRIGQEKDATFLVASGSLSPGAPDDFYVEVARISKRAGQKFVLDTSGKALARILKEGAYLLKPSLEELEDLTGSHADSETEQKQLLLQVLEKYDVHAIVLSLGADGALLASEGKVHRFPAPVVEDRSSIGAGDSLVGGMVHMLARDRPLDEALIFGLACGSATLRSPGTELLHKEHAEELYQKLLSDIKAG